MGYATLLCEVSTMTTQRFCHTQLSQLFEVNLLHCTIPYQSWADNHERYSPQKARGNQSQDCSHLKHIFDCL